MPRDERQLDAPVEDAGAHDRIPTADAERPDGDNDLAWVGVRHRPVDEPQDVWLAELRLDNCAHRVACDHETIRRTAESAPSPSSSRRIVRSSSLSGGVSGTAGSECKSKPVRVAASSSVTPGWRATTCILPSGPEKSKAPIGDTTRRGPPPGSRIES